MSADKDYFALPLREFVDDLAAAQPTPGGGSLAAVVGALAAAQARMVIEFTVGRPKYAAHESRLRELLEELKRAAEMFRQLMSEDMAGYERFAAARKGNDPEERQHATATIVAVPMEIVVLAGAVTARLDEIKGGVNPALFSDLKVAAILAHAAVRSAAANARTNLPDLADRKEAERLQNQLDMLIGRSGRHRDSVLHYTAP
jgi:glutamate formiminotransferase/formiminotetrahydrofolate cyclodeaminase